RLLGDNLLQVLRLAPELLDLIGRRGPRRVAGEPALAGLQELLRPRVIHALGDAWILEPSATGLCEPDLHVFAKLFEDRLERGLEAQAFSGREIGGDDDVLDFFVGHLVDVDLTRQPAAKSTVGVFDPALLPRRIGITKPS